MFGLFFSTSEKIETFADVMACNQEQFKQFFHGMLNEGVYFAPSSFEAGFVSLTHSNEDIQATIAAADTVFKSLKK